MQYLLAWIIYNLISSKAPVSSAVSSNELCATKVCTGCMAGSLSCQEGGLTSLPDQLSSDIQSVILIGHEFSRNYLSRENFSGYPAQTNQLQRLTLRNCGIEKLQPGTFQSLKNLTQLDISQNRLQTIEANTFMGLKLELLRLDENRGLRLMPGAFYQTSFVSLSMNNCDLRFLTYEDLQPLFQNGVLTNLHLTGNKLVTFESRLETVFMTLQSLSIEQNPFVCDCNLYWLTGVLQQRSVRRSTRALEYFGNGIDDSFSVRSAMTKRGRGVPFEGDTQKPVCRTPERLTGRLIEKLTPKDFYCELPQLQSLEIDFSQLNLNLITSEDVNKKAKSESHLNVAVPRVTLRCEIKGSPELEIMWYRRLGSSDYDEFFGRGDLLKLPDSKMIGPGVAEIHLPQTSMLPNERVKSANRKYSGPVDHMVCMASDLSGNASAEVRLKWPTVHQISSSMLLNVGPSSQTQNLYPTAESVDNSKRETGKKLSNPSPKVEFRSDWYFLTGEDPNGFWLQKQFSALQMIGAVVGTFTITLMLFVLGGCLLKAHRLHLRCNRPKVPIHENTYGNLPLTREYTNPPSYTLAPQQSVTSGCYQATNGKSPDTQQQSHNVHHVYQLNSIKHVTDNGAVASELIGAKHLPYATYEPITANDFPPANQYSDSQTYDLPQFPVALSPPKLPLPPVPSGVNHPPLVSCNAVDSRSNFLIPSNPNSVNENATLQLPVCSSPMLTSATEHFLNTISMAATLSRVPHSSIIRGPLQMCPQEVMTPQQYVIATTATPQNRLFNIVNRSSVILPQTQENNNSW